MLAANTCPLLVLKRQGTAYSALALVRPTCANPYSALTA